MDTQKIGKAIRTLRQKRGYTQAELAEILNITDKAVSRWERGLGIPDVSILAKLCSVLNTDIENLLDGNSFYLETPWRGVLLLRENESGILPETKIHGKCSVYFSVSYFLLVGIREITIVGETAYLESAERVLGDGSRFGFAASYCHEEKEAFSGHQSVMVVSSDVFLYGANLTYYLQRAISGNRGISCLAFPTLKEDDRIYFDHSGNLQKRCRMSTSYNRIPVLFYREGGMRLLNADAQEEIAKTAVPLGRGMIYRKIRTWTDVDAVSMLIGFEEENTGAPVYCLEEIAYNRGLISKAQLHALADKNTALGRFLLSI